MEQNIPINNIEEQTQAVQQKLYMRFFNWVRSHPFWTLWILFFLFVLIDIALLPYKDIRLLKQKNPTETAFMKLHAEKAKKEGRPYKKKHIWVPYRSIAEDLKDAVIVAEDGSFWQHNGFDWYEFKESLQKDFEEGRAVRGASTISQQLVKNLYLSPSKNPLRKIKEWILTWFLEKHLSKQRILELYLNVIEWGDGIYGVEAASRQYFGKPASDLTREEAARLAAIIPNPRRFKPNSDSKYVKRRAALILNRMIARGI